jgi:hypothetical protein
MEMIRARFPEAKDFSSFFPKKGIIRNVKESFGLDSGRCFTFEIERSSTKGEEDAIIIHIKVPEGHPCLKSTEASECSFQFPIFVHERGNFFFNTGLCSLAAKMWC